jgi:acetoin:2,6-dichlorophenolindophenol oxidoreductase subunit beta
MDTPAGVNSPSRVDTPRRVRMSYLDAIVQAQIEEMERDERVIMMGEDIAIYGSGDLVDRFGPKRIWPMPISEASFTGVGIGAAIAGLRPIIDLNIASFMYLASDQIINQAAKLRFMTGGQVRVPILFRVCMFYGTSIAAQHSDRPYPLFMNVPGLKIISPTTPADVKGLLKSAVRDDDPVILFEDMRLWTLKDEVPTDPDHLVPIGRADIKRIGSDITLVAIGGAMRPTLEAAKVLAEQGISAEVIDPRTLKPLDMQPILESVVKTGRLIIVENAHRMASASSEIAAIVCEEAFDALRRRVLRLTAPDVHVPFSPVLEQSLFPSKDHIVNACMRLMG